MGWVRGAEGRRWEQDALTLRMPALPVGKGSSQPAKTLGTQLTSPGPNRTRQEEAGPIPALSRGGKSFSSQNQPTSQSPDAGSAHEAHRVSAAQICPIHGEERSVRGADPALPSPGKVLLGGAGGPTGRRPPPLAVPTAGTSIPLRPWPSTSRCCCS